MWIFICGGYRTGSVLQYNLVSELIKRTESGINIGFKKPEKFKEIQDKYSKRKSYVVFKSHVMTPEIEKEFKDGNAIGLKTIRDIRDVVVSLAHKKDTTYEYIIDKRLKYHLDIFEPWERIEQMYVARYETFAFDLQNEIKRIASYLDIGVSDEIVEAIYEKCNIENHKKYIKQLDYSNRKYDNKTMLHPNHIHSGESLQWKSKLTQKQVDKIEDQAKVWLESNGYQLSSEII